MLADDGALSAAELPSDTLVALRLLRSQFPRDGGCDALPRLLLVSQLYSLVTDRAAVDRELAALARAGAIRRFKLATGRDEYAFLLADDYAALIAEARRAAAADRGLPPAALAAAFDGFAHRVLPACPDAAAVATAALRDLLRRPARPGAQPLPERDVDDAVAALMHAGLVTRAMTPGADALLFSAPGTARSMRCFALMQAALCVADASLRRGRARFSACCSAGERRCARRWRARRTGRRCALTWSASSCAAARCRPPSWCETWSAAARCQRRRLQPARCCASWTSTDARVNTHDDCNCAAARAASSAAHQQRRRAPPVSATRLPRSARFGAAMPQAALQRHFIGVQARASCARPLALR